MAMTLAQIREKLKKQQQTEGGASLPRENTLYPFWNISDDQTAVIRFLPDKDVENEDFWVERAVIKLPFSGTDLDPRKEGVIVQVPCMEMFKKTCPVLAEVRTWYKDKDKDPELANLASKYWKKRSWIFQGFVVTDPIKEQNAPENPIRRFTLNKEIFDIVKAGLMNEDIDELPTDYFRGRDFNISKTRNGQWSRYTTSSWRMKERALSAAEREAIEQYGLFNLKDSLGKEPTSEEVEVIAEMFRASVNGEPYDSKRWAEYYKPYGLDTNKGDDQGNSTSETRSYTPAVSNSTPAVNNSYADEEIDEEYEAPKAPVKTAPKTESNSTAKTNPSAVLEALRARAGKK